MMLYCFIYVPSGVVDTGDDVEPDGEGWKGDVSVTGVITDAAVDDSVGAPVGALPVLVGVMPVAEVEAVAPGDVVALVPGCVTTDTGVEDVPGDKVVVAPGTGVVVAPVPDCVTTGVDVAPSAEVVVTPAANVVASAPLVVVAPGPVVEPDPGTEVVTSTVLEGDTLTNKGNRYSDSKYLLLNNLLIKSRHIDYTHVNW